MEHAVHVEAAGPGNGDDRAVFHDFGTHVVIAVADGSGGSGGGAEAAELLVRRAVEQLESAPEADAIVELLRAIDIELFVDRDAGETTAIVVSLADGRIHGASVGDSQAWLVRSGAVEILTSGQNRKPLLGTREAAPVAFDAVLGDATLVLGSDGLFNYAKATAIEAMCLGELSGAPVRLVDAARLRSGSLPDDIAVLLVRATC